MQQKRIGKDIGYYNKAGVLVLVTCKAEGWILASSELSRGELREQLKILEKVKKNTGLNKLHAAECLRLNEEIKEFTIVGKMVESEIPSTVEELMGLSLAA